jgi:hypothetical protein
MRARGKKKRRAFRTPAGLRAGDVAGAETMMKQHLDRYLERGVVHPPAPAGEPALQ